MRNLKNRGSMKYLNKHTHVHRVWDRKPVLARWVREGVEEIHGALVEFLIYVNWPRFVLGLIGCAVLGLLTSAAFWGLLLGDNK